jgi:hypothetical protein
MALNLFRFKSAVRQLTILQAASAVVQPVARLNS